MPPEILSAATDLIKTLILAAAGIGAAYLGLLAVRIRARSADENNKTVLENLSLKRAESDATLNQKLQDALTNMDQRLRTVELQAEKDKNTALQTALDLTNRIATMSDIRADNQEQLNKEREARETVEKQAADDRALMLERIAKLETQAQQDQQIVQAFGLVKQERDKLASQLEFVTSERENYRTQVDGLRLQVTQLNTRQDDMQKRIDELSEQVKQQHDLGNEVSVVNARQYVLLTQQRVIIKAILDAVPLHSLPPMVMSTLSDKHIDVQQVMAASPVDDDLLISVTDKNNALVARDERIKQLGDEVDKLKRTA